MFEPAASGATPDGAFDLFFADAAGTVLTRNTDDEWVVGRRQDDLQAELFGVARIGESYVAVDHSGAVGVGTRQPG